LAWLNKAVRLYPADNKIRRLRGMALYQNGHAAEGCADLFFINKQNKYIAAPEGCK
jgi:Flp pilus assembly protein TadD